MPLFDTYVHSSVQCSYLQTVVSVTIVKMQQNTATACNITYRLLMSSITQKGKSTVPPNSTAPCCFLDISVTNQLLDYQLA